MSYTRMVASGISAALIVLAPLAVTATQSHAPTAPTASPHAGSDRRLAAQLPVVDRIMDILQRARDDYHGDRAHAIDALNKTREDLRLALKADNQNEPGDQRIPNTPVESAAGTEHGTMAASNDRLADARAMLDDVIVNLQQDSHDYGGYRVKAIADLRQARDDITDALRLANTGQGGGASDRSVSATKADVERAIDSLQRARSDYDGHRLSAIKALNDAHEDLAAALKADKQRESTAPPATAMPLAQSAGDEMSQAASNARLRDARAMVATAIDNLRNDNHDYGGYRVKAIEDLQIAQSELEKALAAVKGG